MQYSSIVRWWPVRSLGLLAKHACSIFKNSSLKFFFIWIWSTSVYLAVFGFWRGHYRPCIGCKGEACTRKLSQRSWCTCDAPKWNEGKNTVSMWYFRNTYKKWALSGLSLLESDCRLLRVLPGSLDTGMSTLKSPWLEGPWSDGR